MKKVLLLSMPFGALERPALGISLLKAKLREENIPCDIHYFTFPFADLIGTENYQWLCHEIPYIAFAGDWTFTSALYEKTPPNWENDYIKNILQKTWQLDDSAIKQIIHIKSYVSTFLDYCLEAVDWKDYAIVGFTSTFEQNITSLALAKKIKQRFPHLKMVFGGANWEGEMGLELHRNFNFVDYVCSGESEESFLSLVKHIFAKNKSKNPINEIKGIIFRKNRDSIYTGFADNLRDMNRLPYPDFSDYFSSLDQSSSSKHIFPTLLFETSRGCWWGAKSHCTFCGLNGSSMSFRSKTPQRALEELDYLTNHWKTETVDVVDNILDMKYFDNVIPALAKAKRPFQIFYEVKSNLKREQIKLLQEAGIKRIQPGIESLSNNILKLMRKGTSGLKNIQLLKWAREYNVEAEWNLLYGFPGETAEDYQEILDMLPSIRFFKPPYAVGPIRLDRFSPYYNSPDEFGLKNLRPMDTYKYLYPFDNERLMRIAYYFEFDYENNINPRNNAEEVINYVDWWKKNPENGSLIMLKNADNNLVLYDTRSIATIGEVRFNDIEQAIYEFCDEVHSLTNIINYLKVTFSDISIEETSVIAFLDSLVANRLMITDGIGFLSLAIRGRKINAKETEFSYENYSYEHKPLVSYLPKELPVINSFQKTDCL
jgi:ribosomal peptide maturation radical SAM protein 1